MIQESKKNTFMTKLYPLTKALVMLTAIIAVLVFGNIYLTVGLIIASCLIMAWDKKWTFMTAFLWLIFIYTISLYLIHGLVNPNNVTPAFELPIFGATMYKEGIDFATTYFNRLPPMMGVIIAMMSTVNMMDLGVAMQQAGVSPRGVYMFTSTFQLIPTLNKEREQITNAQRARGLNTEGSIMTRVKAFFPIIVPVVSNSVMSVQQRAISLLTKGFEIPVEKTIYRDLKRGKADKVICAVCWVIIALCFLVVILRLFKVINF